MKRKKMKNPKSCMALTPKIKTIAKQCKALGFIVLADYDDAGTVEIQDFPGEPIYMALQKGHGGPWIVRYSQDYFA